MGRPESVRWRDRLAAQLAARDAPSTRWHPTPHWYRLDHWRKRRLRVCVECGGRFLGEAGQKYGSNACRQRAYRNRRRQG